MTGGAGVCCLPRPAPVGLRSLQRSPGSSPANRKSSVGQSQPCADPFLPPTAHCPTHSCIQLSRVQVSREQPRWGGAREGSTRLAHFSYLGLRVDTDGPARVAGR